MVGHPDLLATLNNIENTNDVIETSKEENETLKENNE